MGVFARWVAGVACLRAGRVRVGVCVFWVLACLLGVVGQCGPAAPLPRLVCLLACSRSGVGVVGVCASRWAARYGAGHDCPAPYSVVCGARLLRAQGEAWRVGCSQGANARTRRETGERGASWGG